MIKNIKGPDSTTEHSVKLLTFNTWGLKYVSKLRKERLQAIGDRLSKPTSVDEDYDIVALQEVWCEEDWIYIGDKCKERYPYRRIFKSGIVSGPGLAILSKIPIESTFLYRFPINGRPSAFFRGDWLVGKSIAITLLKPHTSDSLPIAILNSHMHAPYAQTGDASYSCHRACQAWDFAKFVNMLRKSGYAVIQVGDLNSKPGSLPYKLFTVDGGLSDSWEICHNHNNNSIITPEQIATMNPQEQILHGGITCDSQLNTWRAHRERWEACRLDYALIDSYNIKPINATVKFTDKLPPPLNCSYSDHFAYSTKLVIALKADYHYNENSENNNEKLKVYQELLEEIGRYQKYTIPFQANWRKIHFLLSIIAVIVIHIGIAFAAEKKAWSSVLLLFLSTVIGITGVINGMIWYFGVRSELRALQEVEMEVEDVYALIKDA